MMTRRRLVLDLLPAYKSRFTGCNATTRFRHGATRHRHSNANASPFVYLCDEGQLIYNLELEGLEGAVT
jgi:hypothetical protein